MNNASLKALAEDLSATSEIFCINDIAELRIKGFERPMTKALITPSSNRNRIEVYRVAEMKDPQDISHKLLEFYRPWNSMVDTIKGLWEERYSVWNVLDNLFNETFSPELLSSELSSLGEPYQISPKAELLSLITGQLTYTKLTPEGVEVYTNDGFYDTFPTMNDAILDVWYYRSDINPLIYVKHPSIELVY